MSLPIACRLAGEVIVHGMRDAPVYPALDAAVQSAELVIVAKAGVPGLLLTDGSVLVLSWRQVETLADVFAKWAALGVVQAAKT